MEKGYRVTFECYDKQNPTAILSKVTVLEGGIEKPSNCLDFSIGLENQINLIKNVQDNVFVEKSKLLNAETETCPHCTTKLVKFGSQY